MDIQGSRGGSKKPSGNAGIEEVKSRTRLDTTTKVATGQPPSNFAMSPSKSGVPFQAHNPKSAKSGVDAQKSAPRTKDAKASRSHVSVVDPQAQKIERSLNPGQIKAATNKGHPREYFNPEHLFTEAMRSEAEQNGQGGHFCYDPNSYQKYAGPSQSWDTHQGYAMSEKYLEKGVKHERMIKILRWFAYT